MKPASYARVAGALFAAEAVFGAVHLATGARYAGYTYPYSMITDVWIVAVWLTAAVSGWWVRTWPAFVALLVGALTSLVFGVLFTISTSNRGPIGLGIPFLMAGALQLACSAKSGSAFLEAGEKHPAPEGPEPVEVRAGAPWGWFARRRPAQ